LSLFCIPFGDFLWSLDASFPCKISYNYLRRGNLTWPELTWGATRTRSRSWSCPRASGSPGTRQLQFSHSGDNISFRWTIKSCTFSILTIILIFFL
jgi:hypothetical protein